MQKGFNLLIADRNPHIREFLKREMGAEGYNIQLAKNGREVLKLVNSSTPIDLIIIDLDLPDANELNLFQSLEDRIPTLPFIVHSYLSDYLESSKSLKSVMFVPKQGNSSETLKDVVLNLLKESCIKKYKTPEDWKK
jgi:DNA-binding NtrC family response regulator